MYVESATLFPSAQRTTAVTNSGGTPVYRMWRKAVFLFDLTAAAGASGDVLNVYVDVLAPDGVTWLNAVHFTQQAGNASANKRWAVLDTASPTATDFAVSTDASSGVTRPYLWGPKVRGRYSLTDAGAHGQNVTFSLTAYFVK